MVQYVEHFVVCYVLLLWSIADNDSFTVQRKRRKGSLPHNFWRSPRIEEKKEDQPVLRDCPWTNQKSVRSRVLTLPTVWCDLTVWEGLWLPWIVFYFAFPQIIPQNIRLFYQVLQSCHAWWRKRLNPKTKSAGKRACKQRRIFFELQLFDPQIPKTEPSCELVKEVVPITILKRCGPLTRLDFLRDSVADQSI